MRKISFSLAISAALAFSENTGGERRVPGLWRNRRFPLTTPLEREQLSRMRGRRLALREGPLKRGLKLDAEERKQLIAFLRTLCGRKEWS